MIAVNDTNLNIALDIAEEAFISNPSMLWFIKKDHKQRERMRELCRYCINMARERKGAFLSNDLNGIVLYYGNDAKVSAFRFLKHLIRLLNRATGWGKFFQLLQRQRNVQKMRGNNPHIYVLLLASNHKNGNGTVIEMRDAIYSESERLKLPLFAETASEINKRAYERYGFKTYNEYILPNADTKLWLLRREVMKKDCRFSLANFNS